MSPGKSSQQVIRNFRNMNKISPVIEGHTRLADAIMQNERLLLVIERFGISLGFGDKTINDVAKTYQLNPTLVLAVMNVFNNHSFVVEDILTEEMIPGLMDYLKEAHRFYLDEKLPFIGGLIERFIEITENPDTRLLQSFFKEYADEVREHMVLEDATVFPYIQALFDHARGEKVNLDSFHYCIDDFVEHHSDIEEKLEDLTSLLIKHFPPTKDRFYRNLILLELFALQYDLNDHGGIEDQILVPMVRKLELKTMQNG
ncbi:MAG: hemerythrin domain-containing protein [Mangrovibacterium sp.]